MGEEEGEDPKVVGTVERMSESEFERREQHIHEVSDTELPGMARNMLLQSLRHERSHRDRHDGADIIECTCGKRFCQACIDGNKYMGYHTCRR